MEIPELLFGIVLIGVMFIILKIFRNHKQKCLVKCISKLLLSIFILVFGWIWFVPMQIGWHGEIPVERFRFQVFEVSSDDYGTVPSLLSNLFEYRPSRYGRMYLGKKVGGFTEYFTLDSE